MNDVTSCKKYHKAYTTNLWLFIKRSLINKKRAIWRWRDFTATHLSYDNQSWNQLRNSINLVSIKEHWVRVLMNDCLRLLVHFEYIYLYFLIIPIHIEIEAFNLRDLFSQTSTFNLCKFTVLPTLNIAHGLQITYSFQSNLTENFPLNFLLERLLLKRSQWLSGLSFFVKLKSRWLRGVL